MGTLKQSKAQNVNVTSANGEVTFVAADESREARASERHDARLW